MTELIINTIRGSYPVIIERGIRKSLFELIPSDSVIAIITDDNVSTLYRTEIENNLEKTNADVFWISVKPGENSKSIDTYSQIVEDLVSRDFPRDGLLLGFGGGVVTDITGFVAATYMRGIRWIAVPTSLLAQVDASIGGKTGIHHIGVKNLLGAFHQPSKVIIDPELLRTLSKRQFLSGLAEVFKMAILPGGESFSIRNTGALELSFNRDEEFIEKLISESCAFKKKIVEQDEFDIAGRIILNLGHTLGHAIESAGGFETYTHGEAVSIGVMFVCFLSNENGDLPDDDFTQIRNMFKTLISNITTLDLEWEILHDMIYKDKKRSGGIVRWVYPVGIGKIKIREFDSDHIKQAWNSFKTAFHQW